MGSLLGQQLGDLDGVGGRALAYLVAAAPDIQPVVRGQVVADASHEHQILVAGLQGHGIPLGGEIVHEAAAGGGGDQLTGTLHGDLLPGAYHDGHAVAAYHGDADAGCS